MPSDLPLRPIIATPGSPPIAAIGASMVIREWTAPGPSYLHVHHFDDEAWHVLEGSLRFIFADGEIDAPRSEEHTSELQSRQYLVCRLLLEKKKKRYYTVPSNALMIGTSLRLCHATRSD